MVDIISMFSLTIYLQNKKELQDEINAAKLRDYYPLTIIYVMLCAIALYYHLKNVKSSYGGAFKGNISLLVFSGYLNCTNGTKWHHIQNINS